MRSAGRCYPSSRNSVSTPVNQNRVIGNGASYPTLQCCRLARNLVLSVSTKATADQRCMCACLLESMMFVAVNGGEDLIEALLERSLVSRSHEVA